MHFKNQLFMKINIYIISLFIFLCNISYGQTNYKISFKNIEIETTKNFDGVLNINSNNVFDGFVYQLIQFDKIPNKQTLIDLKNKGIVLEEYIPNFTYLASVNVSGQINNLQSFAIRTIIDIPYQSKLDADLLNKTIPSHAIDKGGNILVNVLFQKKCDVALAKQNLIEKGFNILSFEEQTQVIKLSIKQDDIVKLASLPFVSYAECIPPIPTPDDTRGKSLHRSNAINTSFASGRKYNGDGVTIGIADDGIVGPHIDFKGRLIQLATNAAASATHGDMTSGIAVGAGNVNPTMGGMADGARLVTFDIGVYPQIVNALNNYINYDLTITSTSYSQGCNTYTSNSKFIDDQLRNNRQLIHNFSGGNNASADCGYGGTSLVGWGNITGGYKVGKNVLAVANLDRLGVRDASSSRGPAPDGRIKPDISANGKDQQSTAENNAYQIGGGTSAASPGIGGVTAQLYQAHRLSHSGANPDGTMMKAILLNTAEDIGNVGPDFSFGFGRVNALEAAKAIEQTLYINDTLQQGDSNTFSLTVPTGVVKMNVMIHWRDIGGTIGAAKSLVNDIDMRIKDANDSVYLPWKLDITANVTNLTLPATRGNDDLNNVEQVTILNPAAGVYEVKTKGTTIPFGEQDYYLTYQFIKNDVTLTYPIGGEGFKPTEVELLRWDAHGNTGNFKLSYSVDSGQTYTNISTTINAAIRQYNWTVPNNVSGKVYVKLERGGFADSNDAAMAIVSYPSTVTIIKTCPDSTTLSWTAVAGAAAYEIGKLGAKYMDSVTTVMGNVTTATVYALSSDTNWYCVRAITAQGTKGRRSNAVRKLPGVLNCVVAVDMETSSINFPVANATYFACDSINLKNVVATITNSGINSVNNFDIIYKIDASPPVVISYNNTLNSTDDSTIIFPNLIGTLAVGSHTLKIKVVMAGDLNDNNDSIQINFNIAVSQTLPYAQNFNAATFAPLYWTSIKSSTNSPGWQKSQVIIEKNGASGFAAYFDNYSYDGPNFPKDYLKSNLLIIPANGANLVLDRAYKYFPGYFDSLYIEASTDCGITFPYRLYSNGNKAMATITDSSTSEFFPTLANQWSSDTLDLDTFATKQIIIRFVNVNDFGNNLFIDNVRLIAKPAVTLITEKSQTSFKVFPNPSSNGVFEINSNTNDIVDYKVYDIQQKAITKGTFNKKQILNLGNYSNGIYILHVRTNDIVKTYKLIVN